MRGIARMALALGALVVASPLSGCRSVEGTAPWAAGAGGQVPSAPIDHPESVEATAAGPGAPEEPT